MGQHCFEVGISLGRFCRCVGQDELLCQLWFDRGSLKAEFEFGLGRPIELFVDRRVGAVEGYESASRVGESFEKHLGVGWDL